MKRFLFLALVSTFLISNFAGASEDGVVLFQSTGGDDFVLETSVPIEVSTEAVPGMVSIAVIEKDTPVPVTFSLRGFEPNKEFYKYTDDYHNLEVVNTGVNGEVNFNLDVSSPHLVTIQDRPSTKFIRDDATGGDCATIGSWDVGAKTCTLTQDINETIQIDSNGITLDGGGTTMGTGGSVGSIRAVYVPNRQNVSVRNLAVKNFANGVYFFNSDFGSITDVTVEDTTGTGINLANDTNTTIVRRVTVRNSSTNGITISGPSDQNQILESVLLDNNGIGISVISNNNVVRDSESRGNETGISITNATRVVLERNSFHDNTYDFSFSPSSNIFSTRLGYYTSATIPETNTVTGGKPILFRKDLAGVTFDGATESIGALYCARCANIVAKNLAIENNGVGVDFMDTDNSVIENSQFSDTQWPIRVRFSNGDIVESNTINGGGVGTDIVSIKDSPDTILKNNTISIIGNGVLVSDSKNSIVEGNTVSRPAQLFSSTGISLHQGNGDGTGVIVRNNTISGFTTGISVSDNDGAPTNATVYGNTLSNNINIGIQVGSSRNTFYDNTLTGAKKGFYITSGDPVYENTIRNNLIKDNTEYGIWFVPGVNVNTHLPVPTTCRNNTVYNNDLINNAVNLSAANCDPSNVFNLPLPDGGNYWSDFDTPAEGCTDADANGFCDAPKTFAGDQDNLPSVHPFITEDNPLEECCSSVVFIPGHQASRLYSESEPLNQLWEPTGNGDVEELYLDSSGQSIKPDIKTSGIIDEMFGVSALGNIYKSFISFMDSLASDDTINDWRAFPYDWRKDLSDIVENGVDTSSGHYDMVTEIENLAASSQTGKVTIITHSNGGLVAKFLIDRLVREGKADLVDQIIMVAAPQIGTPQALATLLHGDDIGFPKNQFMDRARQRTLGENMVSAYNLIPSEEYFARVADPVIEFDSSLSSINNWRSLYGADIDDRAELDNFITGGDGRAEPADGDTITPNKLKPALLTQSKNNQTTLDSWSPPENIQVTQIIGWGLDTLRGMRYVARTKPKCEVSSGSTPTCITQTYIDHEPLWQDVVDGDGTVLGVSAGYLDANRYFFNLFMHNKVELFGARVDRSHASILEPNQMLTLLEVLVGESLDSLPPYITTVQPVADDTTKRLRLRVLSPVSIEITNSFGATTNSVSDEIPNGYYLEFGEGKYVGLDSEDIYTIRLQGTDTGTFTFIIEEVAGGEVTDSIVYEDVPVTPQTMATMTIQTVENASSLALDVNGDGIADISLDEDVVITSIDRLNILTGIINGLNITSPDKRSMISKISDTIKLIQKRNIKGAKQKLGDLQNQLRALSGKKLDQDTVINLLQIIETIKLNL